MEKNSALVQHLLRFLESRSGGLECPKFPPLVLYVVEGKPLKATDETKVWSMELPGLQRQVGHQITGDPQMYRIDLQDWTFQPAEGTELLDIVCSAPKLLRMLKKPKSSTGVTKPIQSHKEVSAALQQCSQPHPILEQAEKPLQRMQSSQLTAPGTKLSDIHVEKGRIHPKNSKLRYLPRLGWFNRRFVRSDPT